MKKGKIILVACISVFVLVSCENFESLNEVSENNILSDDSEGLKSAIVGYDSFNDSLNWSFTSSPLIPSVPGVKTICGYSSDNRWGRVSWNWSACPLYPALASTSNGYLQLQVPGNNQKKGAQIETLRDDYGYGSYRAKIMAGKQSGYLTGRKAQGSCNSFFFYNGATGQEIDVEILTAEFKSKKVHFATYPGSWSYTYILPVDPTSNYVEYGFDWYANKIDFFINGLKVPVTGKPAVPNTKGKIIMNHWTGNSWSGMPPLLVSNMSIDYIKHVPFILITNPDTPSVVWSKGTTQKINWDFCGDVSSYPVTIELWKDGSFYQTIKQGAANSGSYTWAIPADIPAASTYQIKIFSALNSGYFDFSNNSFSIQ